MNPTFFRKVKTMFTTDADAPVSAISLKSPTITSPNIIDARSREGYLAGQMLVATPVIDSGCFQKAVVYVFAHNAEGAMGLIVNQPLELVNYSSLLEGMDLPIDVAARELPVFFGGPVERSRGFVLHSSDYQRDFTLFSNGELAVTASSAILSDISKGRGPRKASLIVGYAGWTPGQLEAEIEQNSWISVPATSSLMFDTENELKWATAGESLGVNMALLSTTVGHA